MTEVQRDGPIEEDVLVDLLQRAQQGSDLAAFDGLFLLFGDRVFSYLMNRCHDYETAEEVTAQVFLHLLEKIGLYRIAPRDNVPIFSAWLYRLAYNKMIDVLRTYRRLRHVALDCAENIPVNHLAERVEERIEYETILAKLQYLDDEQRDVMVLRYVEDMSIRETAEIMQKTQSSVKSLQYRALGNLRRNLGL
jgi:RNA polymerase sigma-70 factor, ECF subfamily